MPKNGGLIKFHATLIKAGQTDQLQITVADNGETIPSEEQKKLFKPFAKLNDTKNLNPNGNGLGLSICKSICKCLGGDITVRSQPGDLTEFTFCVNVRISSTSDTSLAGITSSRVPVVKELNESRPKDAVSVQ